MTFLNPAMLLGLFALGLPVAIHLLTRPRFREMRWAAMRYLLPSLKKSRRISTVEDFLLLLLRCILVALLVLIFTRPARLVDPASLVSPEQTATRVIILDQSASMGRSDGLRTRFDRAKAEADAFLTALSPDSANALFLATNGVLRPVARPSQNLTEVRAALSAAALTEAGSDLYPAIKAAAVLLNRQTTGLREIVVFTDGQASAWRQLDALRTLLADSPGITLDVRITGGASGSNLAVASVRPQATFVSVDQSVPVAVEIVNHGKTAVNGVSVKLATDDNAPQAETVIDRLGPGESRVVNLTARFSTPGPHSVTARLPADALGFDDSRTFALRVLPQLRALLVEGAVPTDRGVNDGYFLSRALVPVPADAASRHFIKVLTAAPSELDNPASDKFQLVFLCNVSRLTAAEVQGLRRHVDAGGTLVIFPGPATDLDFFNRDPALTALMPAQLAPARVPETQQTTLAWQSRDYPHPLTALWNTPSSGNLGSVTVSKYFPLQIDEAAALTGSSRVVVSYANGEPAVATRTVGRGRVFLFSSPATTGWTTLPLHSAFVPLLLRMAAQTGGEIGEGLNLSPNQVFTAPLEVESSDAPVSVLRPGDSTRHPAGLVESSGTGAVLRYHETAQAGAYWLFVGEEADPRVLFAVQAESAESDAREIPADELATLTTPPNVSPTSTPESDPKISSAAKVPGPELWATIALAALAIGLLETALAHYFSRSPA